MRTIIARVRERVCGHDRAFTRRNADGPLRVDDRFTVSMRYLETRT